MSTRQRKDGKIFYKILINFILASKKNKVGSKKKSNLLDDPLKGIKISAMKRLLRRSGVKRISFGLYSDIRNISSIFLDEVISSALNYKDSSKRKSVSTRDVIAGLKSSFGITIYGYEK